MKTGESLTDKDLRDIEATLMLALTYAQITRPQATDMSGFRECVINDLQDALRKLEVCEYPQLPAPEAA